MTMEDVEIKEYVKRRYGEIATTEGQEGCGCGCSCNPSATDIALRIGYSEAETGRLRQEGVV